jgi:hypothetical protein
MALYYAVIMACHSSTLFQIARRMAGIPIEKGEGTMKTRLLPSLSLVLATLGLVACGPRTVTYRAEVQPILNQYCLECHSEKGQGYLKSGLLMNSYESLMKGTKYGSVIIPGDSLSSALTMLIEGRADPSIKMPHGRDTLPREKIDILKRWVDQGARNN